MATEQGGHTPGPWECEPDLCHFDTLTTVVGGGHRKGYLGRELIVQVGGYAGAGEATANARLIAAAPDLLDAAKIALSLIDGGRIYEQQCCGGGAECGCRGSTYADEAVHFLRAAIARATGEA